MTDAFIATFAETVARADEDLATPALLIARLEYRTLAFQPYLDRLDRLGGSAADRLRRSGAEEAPRGRIAALNRFLFEEEGFSGNRERYEDPRNSFLNEVLDRRTGIPITLALVYLEVARRAGVRAEGINFPGHFLLRCSGGEHGLEPDVIVDPFHGGALLSEGDCRRLYEQHGGDTAGFERTLVEPATKRQIVVRMLVNLKRLYVRMRSFHHAREITKLLLALDPTAASERRDRGLLSYHLGDLSAALEDLESYLQAQSQTPDAPTADQDRSEQEQIWEHIKALRRRIASFN